MDERALLFREWERGDLRFSELCQDYGISRSVGYKWLRRYQEEGLIGLQDRSRRPHSSPSTTPAAMEEKILALRLRHPSWGGRKIASRLQRKGVTGVPHPSTINDILKRHGMVRRKVRRRRPGHPGRPLITVHSPNDLWAADFKGQFRMRNGEYCYPLTVTDQFSRFLLACKGRLSTEHAQAMVVFERLFREYGLPLAILTDNGSPFASTGLARLSRLSVWWIKLGIHPQLIELGCPQQNGKHERMHRTLKAEATRPPMATLSTQQRCFNRFRHIYNMERPHEAIKMKTPGSLYRHSPRAFPSKLPRPEYPDHFEVRYVSGNHGFRWNNQWVNASSVLVGEHIGFEAVDDGVWSVYFFNYLIGRFHERTMQIEELFKPRRKGATKERR
jgi:transposase InsO family protein